MADYDPNAHRAGYLPATDYALPHLSRFTVAHEPESHMLRHVNCGLLSTPGVPPTLLALKQHAQSLAYLIAMLEPHGSDNDAVEVLLGRVDSVKKTHDTDDGDEEDEGDEQDKIKNKGESKSPLKSPVVDLFGFQGLGLRRRKKVRFSESVPVIDSAPSLLRLVAASRDKLDYRTAANPFDWLDFRRPYTNDEDPDHHRPLLDLVNEVHAHNDVRGTTYHCPLTTYKPRNTPSTKDNDTNGTNGTRDEKVRPYASHHNLLMHANMCLERLDHEYAATGGLLSLLPTTGTDTDTADQQAESPQLSAARNTLVGQWLVFTQQLVGRLHELEISYANAVHVLAGETVLAPYVSLGGNADKNTGSRWILANAGDDVWSLIHDKLDAAAAAASAQIAQRRTEGVVGERAITPSANSLLGLGVVGMGTGASAAPLPDNHLVHVDVTTRYYRTGVVSSAEPDKASRGPIFISPAKPNASNHTHAPVIGAGLPDVAGSTYPLLSASALEKRYDGQLCEAARVARENTQLTQRLIQRTNVLLLLRHDHARLQKINAALQEAVDQARGNAGPEAPAGRGVKRARRS